MSEKWRRCIARENTQQSVGMSFPSGLPASLRVNPFHLPGLNSSRDHVASGDWMTDKSFDVVDALQNASCGTHAQLAVQVTSSCSRRRLARLEAAARQLVDSGHAALQDLRGQSNA